MTFALRSTVPANDAAAALPNQVGGYTLLNALPGGLRSDVWLALADGASLDAAVLFKWFVPHDPGPALENLRSELDLAATLEHDNVARTLKVGFEAGRHYQVKEYLDGVTLHALLGWAARAGVRLANAAVARVLLALISAVDHAERLSQSVSTRVLCRQPISEEDVFVTYDGRVKLLGFKKPLGAAGRRQRGACTATEPAVDALLSEHLSPELSRILAVAPSRQTQIRPCDRLKHVGEVLLRWQSDMLRSDGQRELAGIMALLPATARAERHARLAAALDGLARGERTRTSPGTLAEEHAPHSGVRRVASGVRPISEPDAGPASTALAPLAPAPLVAPARAAAVADTAQRACLLAVCVAVVLIMYAYSHWVGT